MRRFAMILMSSATLLLAPGNADSQALVGSEDVLGGNENPPVISDGSGSFRAQLEGDRISFRLTYDVASEPSDPAVPVSDVTQAHLHIANPGNNGGIVAFLCSNVGTPPGATARECPDSPGEVTGDIVAADVLAVSEGAPPVEIIAAGDLEGLRRLIEQSSVYVNVHSDDHPGGEIRGQMLPRDR
jgi:CHRD domain